MHPVWRHCSSAECGRIHDTVQTVWVAHVKQSGEKADAADGSRRRQPDHSPRRVDDADDRRVHRGRATAEGGTRGASLEHEQYQLADTGADRIDGHAVPRPPADPPGPPAGSTAASHHRACGPSASPRRSQRPEPDAWCTRLPVLVLAVRRDVVGGPVVADPGDGGVGRHHVREERKGCLPPADEEHLFTSAGADGVGCHQRPAHPPHGRVRAAAARAA